MTTQHKPEETEDDTSSESSESEEEEEEEEDNLRPSPEVPLVTEKRERRSGVDSQLLLKEWLAHKKTEMKWRKADREREKKQRKRDEQSRKEEFALKKKEALRRQKKEERLLEESHIRKAADATRRVESALANFPKIGDKQPLDTAIESLESNFKHADLLLEH